MAKTLLGIRSIEDFALEDKRVFVRVDFNVPMEKDASGQQKIADDTRIRAAAPTLEYLIKQGAKIILASHLGRPKGPEDRAKFSLEPIAEYLTEKYNKEVILVEDPASDAPKALLAGLKPSQILLLENLRLDPREEENGRDLASRWAEYTDVYINDAFGASHRAHASIVGLPQLVENKGIGFLMKKEIDMLDHVKEDVVRPFTVVMGGAKVSDKIDLIENMIERTDALIIGGAMAYTFLAAQNIAVGMSRVEKEKLSFARELIARMNARGKKLLLPIDHVVAGHFESNEAEVTKSQAIASDKMGLDIGPQTRALFANELARSKTIFWNGPMGVFEREAYSAGTFAIAQAIAESDATSIVGGGDSASAAQASGFADKFTHISTGGGASLEFLQGDKLPGIEALRPPKRSETGPRETL